MKQGFTLLELLVVVLIIGILAAIALPQYQKAVEKSKATQAITLLKSVYQAAEMYRIANGSCPTSFDELAVDISWTGNTKWRSSAQDTRSNEDWSLQLDINTTNYPYCDLWVGRISGPYAGTGFLISIEPHSNDTYTKGNLYCAERVSGGVTYEGAAGSYCKRIFKGQKIHGGTYRGYTMP